MKTKEEIKKEIFKLDRKMMKVGGLGGMVIAAEIAKLIEAYEQLKKEGK